MKPQFSHRMAMVVNSPYFLTLGEDMREAFRNLFPVAQSFSDLPEWARDVVVKAEMEK